MCQLYMFRTVTVHPQELLCRYCMCRLWYVVRSALPDTSSWYNALPAGRISTYRSLHIQYLQRSSWGWTVTVRNMYSWHLSTNKHLISATTLCISLDCIYIAKIVTRTFQCRYSAILNSQWPFWYLNPALLDYKHRYHSTLLTGCCRFCLHTFQLAKTD